MPEENPTPEQIEREAALVEEEQQLFNWLSDDLTLKAIESFGRFRGDEGFTMDEVCALLKKLGEVKVNLIILMFVDRGILDIGLDKDGEIVYKNKNLKQKRAYRKKPPVPSVTENINEIPAASTAVYECPGAHDVASSSSTPPPEPPQESFTPPVPGVCSVCGGPRSSTSGSMCLKCYKERAANRKVESEPKTNVDESKTDKNAPAPSEIEKRYGAFRATLGTVQHGVYCEKVPHTEDDGFTHSEADDGPYEMNGTVFCGRCHVAICDYGR